MRLRWTLLLPLALALAPSPALALKPAKHRSLAEASCKDARLPTAFCRRVGQAVFETDYREWDDLAAHAQTERGQDRCAAADAAANRVETLGRSVVTSIDARNFDRAALDLGRALHTLQDECAHHGMTNEEHAVLSLTQTCSGDTVSPDVQPEALACATQRTAAVMQIVADALRDTPWNGAADLCTSYSGEGERDICATAVLPSAAQACDFLGLFDDWTGTDTTWNGALVGTALVDAFTRGLHREPITRTVCGGDPAVIDPPSPHVPASTGVTCSLVDVGCLGKVDGEDDGDVSPYGDDEESSTGGCSSTRGSGDLALVGVAGLFARRRRRHGKLH